MNDEELKLIAAQLRKPSGEHAVRIAAKMNEANQHINIFTIQALKLSPNDNILEIGMGNGYFVKDIVGADPSVHYTGCDFSEVMVDEARKRNQEFIRSGHARFYPVNAERLPFDDETFDKVFSINTIYFWDNLSLVLSEVHRVLKPKGKITIAVRPKSVLEHYPFSKFGFSMFSRHDLAEVLPDNGFDVVEIIEKEEPDQEINGRKFKVETLLASATKQ